MKRLTSIGLSALLIVLTVFTVKNVSAEPKFVYDYPKPNLSVTKTSNNNYSLQVGTNVIPIGSATASFTPAITFPCWQGYPWNASIGLSMGVTGNALAMANMTSTSTATSVTASNSYFGITYGGVPVKEGFNETGGVDINITLKRSIGNILAFSFNSTNITPYLQPSLTKEWTVGQDLGDGRIVKSVTDTDVTDDLGNNVVHRPEYVVNAIAFYSTTSGGTVTQEQANSGLTTGQIGMLYNLNVIGANGVNGKAYWSIQNANTLWLNFNTTGMTYPIQITPSGDTFGYTSVGSSGGGQAANQLISWGALYTGAAGTGTSISIYAVNWNTTSQIQLGLYAQVGTYVSGSSTQNYVQKTSNVTLSNTQTWYTGNFVSNPTLSATNYWICFIGDDASYNTSFNYNSAGSYAKQPNALTFGNAWPSTETFTTNGSNLIMSIYCTYTAAPAIAISNSASTYTLNSDNGGSGIVMPNTTYYSNPLGSTTSPTVGGALDAECEWTLTNTSTAAIDLTCTMSDYSGGSSASTNSNAGTNGATSYGAKSYFSGQASGSWVVIKSSGSSVGYSNLAANTNIKWGFLELTQTNYGTGVTGSTAILLLTATLH